MSEVVTLRMPIPLESMATVQEFVERVYGTGDTRLMFDGDHMRVIAPEEGWGERKRGRGKLPSASNDALRLKYAQLRDGTVKLAVEDMEATILYVSEIARQWFELVGGINYVETQLVAGGQDEPSFLFTMQRAAGKTPHDLRQEAEAERGAAVAALEKVRALLTRESGAGRGFYLSPLTHLAAIKDLYSDDFAAELAAAVGLDTQHEETNK